MTDVISDSTGPNCEAFEVLGVRLSFESDDAVLVKTIADAVLRFFPFKAKPLEPQTTEHHFVVVTRSDAYQLVNEFGSQELVLDETVLLKHLRSLARIAVASNAPDLLFIHAGVVAIDGRGLIFPGDSHSGKTTLVKELVERGASYYSDEYAVLDLEGRLLPFAKPLSVRVESGNEIRIDLSAAEMGGSIGTEPIAVDNVIFTRYREHAVWSPARLAGGEGVLRIIPHAIGFTKRPEFSLKILQKGLEKSQFFVSDRDDVKAFSQEFLETLDK